MQQLLHYTLHFLFPLAIAFALYRKWWKKAYVVLVLTMLVDLDHLLSSPVFVPCRCSIGFHPLHSYPAIFIYMVLLLHPRLRIIAIGLLLHMLTDAIDCGLSSVNCEGR